MIVETGTIRTQTAISTVVPNPNRHSAVPAVSQQENSVSIRTWRELDRLEKEGVRLSIDEEQILRAVERALKALEGPFTMFEMRVHEPTNAIIIRVLNRETGELIREIPPEKTLDLVAKMMEFAGLLIDERV